jgi:hypothetical protein
MSISNNLTGAVKQSFQPVDENKKNDSVAQSGIMNLLDKIGNFVTGVKNRQTGNNSFEFDKVRNNNEKPIKFWAVKFNSFQITEAANRMSNILNQDQSSILTAEQITNRAKLFVIAQESKAA